MWLVGIYKSLSIWLIVNQLILKMLTLLEKKLNINKTFQLTEFKLKVTCLKLLAAEESIENEEFDAKWLAMGS